MPERIFFARLFWLWYIIFDTDGSTFILLLNFLELFTIRSIEACYVTIILGLTGEMTLDALGEALVVLKWLYRVEKLLGDCSADPSFLACRS